MRRTLLIVITALTVLAGSALVHGYWTDRWRKSPEREAAPAKLQQVPMTIGDWEGEPLELGQREFARAGIDGYIMRNYKNRLSGAEVSILLVCGRPGPVAAHTPEICYGGAGYELTADPIAYPIRSDHCWTALFRKQDAPVHEYLRIVWSWTAGETWLASSNPRLEFAADPVLYKIYVVRKVTSLGESITSDPCIDFLRQLMPEMMKVLSSSKGN